MPDPASTTWIVKKFGGTSVSTADCWQTIADQANRARLAGENVLIVVSALSGVTNLLTELCESRGQKQRGTLLQEIWRVHRQLLLQLEIDPGGEFQRCRENLEKRVSAISGPLADGGRAEILAHGELLSSILGVQALKKYGVSAAFQDARQLLQSEPGGFFNPLSVRCKVTPDPDLGARLADQASIHITQGFIVGGPGGETCLLGRGGSDTSAASLAAVLQARALEIWTDVPGMFSADPRIVKDARLLKSLGYREAQELASMGAKVLHPPSIQPVREHGIPLFIKDTQRPEFDGTCISSRDREAEAQVKGIVSRRKITLINMATPSMWGQAGFLADAFTLFKQQGFSVDLISTSESEVTVTLDPLMEGDTGGRRINALLEQLAALCRVEVHHNCVSISLVGNAIRTILGQIASALDVFHDRQVHMVTQSANDLNLTLVVDEEHAESLVRKLHQLLIAAHADHRPEFGPTWANLTRQQSVGSEPEAWWRSERSALIELMGDRDCAYVYHLETACDAAQRLQALSSVDRILYSVKANDHPAILQAFSRRGLGFECVALNEVKHVLDVCPELDCKDILFTPNFAPRGEYEQALELGVQVTIDNAWVLTEWPELFVDRSIFLRLDLERGYGHHKKVVTSGKDSKFGIALEHLDSLGEWLNQHRIRVVGLHAHTGSGVIDAGVWHEQLQRLASALPSFPDARVLDLGGGLGVPDRPLQPGFNLAELDALLTDSMKSSGLSSQGIKLWLEPGRYLVSESGVLLARVTQIKDKGRYHYVGVATGMNSLIRPALYGAYHEIVNLNRLEESPVINSRIVGPICESGDILGESRLLPPSAAGELLLIANAGAYGRVMASHYNRRQPAEELIFDTRAV